MTLSPRRNSLLMNLWCARKVHEAMLCDRSLDRAALLQTHRSAVHCCAKASCDRIAREAAAPVLVDRLLPLLALAGLRHLQRTTRTIKIAL